MTTQETFKKVLEDLGFANHKPSQMTNSDYWLCTNTAMEQYAKQEVEADRNRCKIITDDHLLKRIKKLESLLQEIEIESRGTGNGVSIGLYNRILNEIKRS